MCLNIDRAYKLTSPFIIEVKMSLVTQEAIWGEGRVLSSRWRYGGGGAAAYTSPEDDAVGK